MSGFNSSSLLKILFFVICIAVLTQCKRDIDTILPRSKPGLKAPKKLWWAKEVTPNYHIAGRLTERQIRYAKDAGFKSIVSFFNYEFTDNSVPYDKFGKEKLPNGLEARAVATMLSELSYYVVLEAEEDWATETAVKKLGAALEEVPKPVLLHCDRGYTITLALLLHLANKTRHDPQFRPIVNSEKLYKMTAMMGLDFTDEEYKQLISKITDEEIVKNPPKPNTIPEEWLDYWLVHPVYKNYFTAGQIRKGHLPVIEEVGFKHVVNMRLGKTFNGRPSQETVTLVNVKDGTPTYAGDGHAARQTDEALQANRLDTKIGVKFIPSKKGSDVDFERRNKGEFGDDVGYNEELERKAFEKTNIKYYHMPIDPEGTYAPEIFGQYKDQLLDIGKTGEPIIVHCASAHRVAYMSVLAAALQYEKDMQWALKRIRELGFEVNKEKKKDVYNMFQYWLDRSAYDARVKTEL